MKERIGKMIIKIGERISGKRIEEVDYGSIEKILIQPRYLENFTIREIREKKREWIVELAEKDKNIPKEIKDKTPVMNGYMNPIEIIDHTLQGKLVYLRFYRRKWKEKGKKES